MVGRVGRWEGREGRERKDDPEATCYLVQQQLEIECDFHIGVRHTCSGLN